MKELIAIQAEIKAPKGQVNKFGNYNYRSCEDILEAVKPLLAKHNATILITDEVKSVNEHIYIYATVYFRWVKMLLALKLKQALIQIAKAWTLPRVLVALVPMQESMR